MTMPITKLLFCIFAVIILLLPKPVKALENPLAAPNNPFGIHVIDELDLDAAASLVNSNGGDWGYVTLVIRRDERNIKRWQDVFDKMRRLHLIPIVRIATRMEAGHWEKGTQEDIDSWVYFLNSLNWVTKNRYVVIGNEPNHATEWGGEVNPEEYAKYLTEFSRKLKDGNPEFFVLPAGLDASAPTDNRSYMSESEFLRRMYLSDANIFNIIDGWTSHSYPNPGFSGSADDRGRGTVKTYEWELDYLKNLGVTKTLPVFITETGWVHDMGGEGIGKSESDVSESLKKAFSEAWKDERIVAITPFILNYQAPPFDKFSWKKKDGSFYKFYNEVQGMTKPRGEPVQKKSGKILAVLTPPKIKKGGEFVAIAYIENTGQSIWKKGEIALAEEGGQTFEIEPMFSSEIEPFEKGFIFFNAKAPSNSSSGYSNIAFKLNSGGEKISDPYNASFKFLSENPEESNEPRLNFPSFLVRRFYERISLRFRTAILASI